MINLIHCVCEGDGYFVILPWDEEVAFSGPEFVLCCIIIIWWQFVHAFNLFCKEVIRTQRPEDWNLGIGAISIEAVILHIFAERKRERKGIFTIATHPKRYSMR